MGRIWIGLVFLFCGAVGAWAQTVSTVLPPGSSLSDGIAIDSRGTVFVSAVGAGRVHKVSLDGTHTVLEHRFDGPTGLAFDAADNLYIANEVGNYISKVSSDGQLSRFVPQINNPGGLAFGPDGILYVTLKDDNGISKVDRDGQVEEFVASGSIPRPVGLAVTAEGTVYAASITDGGIYRITPEGAIEKLSTVSYTAGSLAVSFMALVGDQLYVASISDHFIYQVNLDGEARVFAGTGDNGRVDGPVATAQFNGPHGIAYNPVDNALYISDFNTKALRRIALPEATAVHSSGWAQIKNHIKEKR
jgi:sugar lactone lactonase YvrE